VLTPQLINNPNFSKPDLKQDSIKVKQIAANKDRVTFNISEHIDANQDIFFNTKKATIKKIEIKSLKSENISKIKNGSIPFGEQTMDIDGIPDGIQDSYKIIVTYGDNKSTQVLKGINIPKFKNYNIKKLKVSNLSAKQNGYNKAKISFNINQIIPEDDKFRKKDIILKKLEIRVKVNGKNDNNYKVVKEFDTSFGYKEFIFDKDIGSYNGYSIYVKYEAKDNPDAYGINKEYEQKIQPFIIEKIMSLQEKLVLGISIPSGVIVLILLVFLGI